jgi:hypothetical protein
VGRDFQNRTHDDFRYRASPAQFPALPASACPRPRVFGPGHERGTASAGIGKRGDAWGAPYLGNRVFAGLGVKMLGPVTVGDDVAIGAMPW